MKEQIYANFALTRSNYSFKNKFSNGGITQCKQDRFNNSMKRERERKETTQNVISNHKHKNNKHKY